MEKPLWPEKNQDLGRAFARHARRVSRRPQAHLQVRQLIFFETSTSPKQIPNAFFFSIFLQVATWLSKLSKGNSGVHFKSLQDIICYIFFKLMLYLLQGRERHWFVHWWPGRIFCQRGNRGFDVRMHNRAKF